MKYTIILTLLLISSQLRAQSISGHCPQTPNTQIRLLGFEGLSEKELAQSTTDQSGHFVLNYPSNYVGAAVLQVFQAGSLVVLLNKENFSISWPNQQDATGLTFKSSVENQAFDLGIKTFQNAEQKSAALNYLLPLYENDSDKLNWIHSELNLQKGKFTLYLNQLPQDCYVAYYLKLRNQLSELSKKTPTQQEQLAIERFFSNLDFNDQRLWHSGLLKELLETQYKWIFERTDRDSLITRANQCSNIWINGLKSNGAKQQEVAEMVFKMLEQYQLSRAAEHVALSMLNQSNCQLDAKRSNLFEQYRKLAIGQVAPNIQLGANSDLKSLGNKYKLVVFGASWCPNCQADYPSLMGVYRRVHESSGMEIIYISIDTDMKAFNGYYSEAPFITYCDAKGWETQAAKDYYVCATPTYMLLDTDLNILAKFQSPQEIENWLNAQ